MLPPVIVHTTVLAAQSSNELALAFLSLSPDPWIQFRTISFEMLFVCMHLYFPKGTLHLLKNTLSRTEERHRCFLVCSSVFRYCWGVCGYGQLRIYSSLDDAVFRHAFVTKICAVRTRCHHSS